MLDSCSRYGVMIAPWSTYIGDDSIRRRILTKHTLLYSINMPVNLFQPNASTYTTICVFKTHQPHSKNQLTTFYLLDDDGYVLTKTKGRADIFNRWSTSIKPKLLQSLQNPRFMGQETDPNVVCSSVYDGQEWIIQDHLAVDYSDLKQTDFEKTVKEYAVFIARLKSDRVEAAMSELDWIDLVTNYLSSEPINSGFSEVLEYDGWREFPLCDRHQSNRIFDVAGAKLKFTSKDITNMGRGTCLYVTTSNKNNAVSGSCSSSNGEKNVITVDSATDGKSFYQDFLFVGSDHVEVLHPRGETELDEFSGLFVVTLLNHRLRHYGYGRKRAQKRLRKETILLPTKDGLPDWRFMSDFIKSLPYSSSIH